MGEGEWAAAKHRGRGKRAWKKLHLGPDRSAVTFAEILTDRNVDDVKTAFNLVDEVGSDIASFTADAAYDTAAHLRCCSSTQRQSLRFSDQDSNEIETARHPTQGSRSHNHEGEGDRSPTMEDGVGAVIACNILNTMAALRRTESIAIGS